jgi:hypothetical protein
MLFGGSTSTFNEGSTGMRPRHARANFGGEGATHGVVYGLRNWRVNGGGYLTGVIYKQAVWLSGENTARCYRRRPAKWEGEQPDEGWEVNHPMEACEHGWHAYFDGSRDYHEKGDITGIIRGWGTTEIGEKGFRTTTAKIVAIKFSGTVPDDVRALVLANYPDAAVFKTVASMLTEFPLTAEADEPDEPIEEAS